MEPPGSAHSNPTLVLGCHSPGPGPVGKAPAEGHPSMPPHKWYSLAGFGAQQGSVAQGRGTREGKVCGNSTQTLAWKGSHQPAAQGGFLREQLHLAPGHGNYC